MSATTPDHIPAHSEGAPEVGKLDLSRPSGKRTTKSGCASVFMIVATLLAVIPLVWLLFAAIRRGIGSL
ncbi:MAG: phosphate ABC transporter, permease protein PstA, partial [Cutibacterium avidum]|nr:phosphate ABC transporter, permease protein PstA [Cutibacterium avidum]